MIIPTNNLDSRLISGSFIQFDHWDDGEAGFFQDSLRSLTVDHWRQTLQDMANIGIDTLVFQQAVDARNGVNDIRAYYPSKYWKVPDFMKLKTNLYDEVIDEADKLGMKVYHSIYAMHLFDPYWQNQEAINFASKIADEVFNRYGNRKSFAGFYWTYEYPPGCVAGRDSLMKVVQAIRNIVDCPIMIAPNVDRPLSSSTLQDIDVDIIAYQDTVGLGVEPDIFGRHSRANRFKSLARLPYLYEQLKFIHDGYTPPEAKEINLWNYYTRKRGRTLLWNDLEIWEFDHKQRLVPTELSRIVAQLELSAPFVDKQIIYQYVGLMNSPRHPVQFFGDRASLLYEGYQLYRNAILKQRDNFKSIF